MKKHDRALKAKGFRLTTLKPGVTTESMKLANGHNIDIKTVTVATTAQQKNRKGEVTGEVNRHWTRSTVVPESTMR